MTKKDFKKNEHVQERQEIAPDIISIRNLKSFSQKKKDELIKEFLGKKELTQSPVEQDNPFPQHKGYTDLWKKLIPDQQKEMKANIRISTDGKIEMIKMKKKFSMLTAQHNGKDIFDGSYKDKKGNTGIKGVTYLTGRAAEKVCKEQNKKLLNDKTEVEKFISYFPGKTTQDKIFNFVQLFGLEKSGYWDPSYKKWHNIGSLGYAIFSRVNENADVCEARWNVDNAYIFRRNQKFPSPFVACEDC